MEVLVTAGIFLGILVVAWLAGGATFFLMGMRNMELSGIGDSIFAGAFVFIAVVVAGVWVLL